MNECDDPNQESEDSKHAEWMIIPRPQQIAVEGLGDGAA